MAAYQNSTYYFVSSNLTTQPECSTVLGASFQPTAATSEEPQPVRQRRFSASPGQTSASSGGTTSFAKRELFRAPRRMFYQV